ncbi:SH3 domain-containing protein [Candidatus Saccharibacteria bacterium]|nr:SH3 domain-containing protein [Candidatus Saccharibacteria bacterium]
MKKDKSLDLFRVGFYAIMTLLTATIIFMVIMSNNVASADAVAPTDCSVTASVNLRSRPNKNTGTVLTTIKGNVKRIAEYYGDYQWSLVATLDYYGNPNRLGFVMSRYLSGSQSSITLSSYQSNKMTVSKDIYAYLSTNVAACGMIPVSSSVTVLGTVSEFTLVELSGNLYLVKSTELWGYDPGIQPGSYPYEAKVVAKTGKTVNFRSTPNTTDKNNVIEKIPLGYTVTVTGQYNATWSIVSYNGRTGYMMSEFLYKKESGGTTEPYFDPYITLWDHTLHTYYGDYVLPEGVSYALLDADWVRVDDY